MNNCQNLRRPAKDRPDAFSAQRQRAAAAAQSAKPFGSSASSLARIACANTGAAPSVEMPITSGERLTMAPKEKSQKAGLSMTLTGTPAARAAAAKVRRIGVVLERADRDRSACQIVRVPAALMERRCAARWFGRERQHLVAKARGIDLDPRAGRRQQFRLPGRGLAAAGEHRALALEREEHRQARQRA